MDTKNSNLNSMSPDTNVTRIITSSEFQNSVNSIREKQKTKIEKLKSVASGLAVAGLGAVGYGFVTAPSDSEIVETQVPSEPKEAHEVSDKMTFQEAFSSARDEVGSGGYFEWHGQKYSTYYKEEWDLLSDDQKNQFSDSLTYETNLHTDAGSDNDQVYEAVTIHDTAPVAEHIDDSMSFNDAFALARNEVGPGGVFSWHGETYSTYTSEERANMSEDQISEYENSLHHANINPESVSEANFVNVDTASGTESDGSHFIGRIDINGVPADVYEEHGHQIVKIDLDSDGNHDFTYDVNEDLLTNNVTGEHITGEEFMNSQHNVNADVVPLDTQVMNIEGYDVQFTTFSDGHQEANVDFNNDGNFDAHMNLDANGQLTVYDVDGNLIHQEQIDMSHETLDGSNVDLHLAHDAGVQYDDASDFDNNANVDDWV